MVRPIAIAVVVIAAIAGAAVRAQSLSGIKIGDPPVAVLKIGLDPIARNRSGPFETVKWKLIDENELSVTVATQTNRIVYIENDWGHSPDGSVSDFPGKAFNLSRVP